MDEYIARYRAYIEEIVGAKLLPDAPAKPVKAPAAKPAAKAKAAPAKAPEAKPVAKAKPKSKAK